MSILIRRQQYTRRFDIGGSIPVYGSFQPKFAEIKPYDPSILLKKYASTPKAATEEKAKDLLPELKELDGLSSSNYEASDELVQMEEQVRDLLKLDPERKMPQTQQMLSEYNFAVKHMPIQLKNEKNSWEKGNQSLKDQGGHSEYYTDLSNNFVANVYNEEGQLVGYTKARASDINQVVDGLRIGQPLSYGDVSNKLDNSNFWLKNQFLNLEHDENGSAIFSKDETGNLIPNPYLKKDEFIQNLNNGMSYAYLREKEIDPAFKDIGENLISVLKKSGGNVNYDKEGKIIVTDTEEHQTAIKTNAEQIVRASMGLYDNLTPAAKLAMRGVVLRSALNQTNPTRYMEDEIGKDGKPTGKKVKSKDIDYTKPPTDGEIYMLINQKLLDETAKRLNASEETKDVLTYNLKAMYGDFGKGGVGGPLGEVTAATFEVTGGTTPEVWSFESGQDKKASTKTEFVAYPAPAIQQTIIGDNKGGKKIVPVSQTQLGKIANADKLTTIDGVVVNDLIFSGSDEGMTKPFLEGLYIDPAFVPKIAELPVYINDVYDSNGKLLHRKNETFKFSNPSKINAQAEKITAQYADDNERQAKLAELYIKNGANPKLVGIGSYLINKYTYNAHSLYRGVTEKINSASTFNALKSTSLDPKENSNSVIDKINADNKDFFNDTWTSFDEEIGQSSSAYRSVFLLAPTNSIGSIQVNTGGKVYTDKSLLSLEHLIRNNQANTPMFNANNIK